MAKMNANSRELVREHLLEFAKLIDLEDEQYVDQYMNAIDYGPEVCSIAVTISIPEDKLQLFSLGVIVGENDTDDEQLTALITWLKQKVYQLRAERGL